jgi:thiamine-monophosphate kinase
MLVLRSAPKKEDSMTLGDVGEFGLIRHIKSLFHSDFPKGVEGIGNDCAVIPFQENLSYLVATDLLNEEIHFIKSKITPIDLGYKSLAVNLSDIAAMGGKPLYAFLSIGFPPETSIEWIDAFFAGFHQLAGQTGVLLLGGDTTRANQIAINVLLIGCIETSLIRRRSQAQAGDLICCTGYLGDSGAGFKILLEELPQNALTQHLVQAHVRPRPHLEEGAWLAAQPGVHAMMDISDGLASDIQRIMEESHCGACLAIEHLPLSHELRQASRIFGWSSTNLALTAGEDYCLLVTIDPTTYASIQEAYQQRFHHPLFHLGTILPSPSLEYTLHHKIFPFKGNGFDHFHKPLAF